MKGVAIDSTMQTSIENLSLKLVDTGNQLTKSRKLIVDLALSTILDAFHARKPKNTFKLEPKNMMMTSYHGYSIKFYQMVSGVKQWVTWNLFPELVLATGGEGEEDRNFRAEIKATTQMSPSVEYASTHQAMIDQFSQIESVTASARAAQSVFVQQRVKDKEVQKLNSKKVKEQIDAQLGPEERAALEEAKQKAKRVAMRCFSSSAADGDGSGDSSSDSDSNGPAITKHKHKNKNKSSSPRSPPMVIAPKQKKIKAGDKVNDVSTLLISGTTLTTDNTNTSNSTSPTTTSVVQSSVNNTAPTITRHDVMEASLLTPDMNRSALSDITTSSDYSAGSSVRKVSVTYNDEQMFNGTAGDDSQLHDADIGSEQDSDEDAEFDFKNPGVLFRSATKASKLSADNESGDDEDLMCATTQGGKRKGESSTVDTRSGSGGTNKPKKRRRSSKNLASINPEKLNEKLAAQQAQEESRAARLETAQKKRDVAKNERRLELANEATGPAIDGSVRKKRSACAISSEVVQNYICDFDLNRVAANKNVRSNASLIADALESVVGPSNNSSAMTLHAPPDENFNSLTANEKMQQVDRNFKEGLMMYCQVELFKDVTFERLLVNYCIAKREASGFSNHLLFIFLFLTTIIIITRRQRQRNFGYRLVRSVDWVSHFT